MAVPISQNVWKALKCSSCGHGLEKIVDGARCANCTLTYPYTDSGLLTRRDLENMRHQHFTGSFTFIATKPSE